VAGSSIRVELTERRLLTTNPAVRDSLRRITDLDMARAWTTSARATPALAYLQRFHLQFLKIDRFFVSRLGQSARATTRSSRRSSTSPMPMICL
jgi:EAL domain-containing protein (putative c-di-GMP-specific phosphodiesterase class I)